MRDNKIFDIAEIEKIFAECKYCNMAMVTPDGEPYVIPMNFGYKNRTLYFHAGPKGQKLDFLRNNPKVCVSFSTGHELRYQNEQVACSYSMKFKSILAKGKVEFVPEKEDKIAALDIIMSQYASLDFKYSDPAVNNVVVFKLPIEEMDARIK